MTLAADAPDCLRVASISGIKSSLIAESIGEYCHGESMPSDWETAPKWE
ncbi:hypothetical protein COXBURSA334_1787 [Coxiella burnetii Q321]|nr:hypothetical protein COXBURSA334_1787 [Coxiella burnetii Q321]